MIGIPLHEALTIQAHVGAFWTKSRYIDLTTTPPSRLRFASTQARRWRHVSDTFTKLSAAWISPCVARSVREPSNRTESPSRPS